MSSKTNSNPAANKPDPGALYTKNLDQITITETGRAYLKPLVTDTQADVFALTGQLDPERAAASYARLSRSSNGIRELLVSEFAEIDSPDNIRDDYKNKLLERIISNYGDDSVQQLAGIHVVIEGASNLLTKEVEWGRLAAYLEQSSRYLDFGIKGKNGHYRYYQPPELPDRLQQKYCQTLDTIFEKYNLIRARLVKHIKASSTVPADQRDRAFENSCLAQASDAARVVLPVATQATVGIFASAQALENLIMRLRASRRHEARQVGSAILAQARQIMPVFFQRADQANRGGAYTNYLTETKTRTEELVSEIIKANPVEPVKAGTGQASIDLYDYYPSDQNSLIADIIHETSDLSIKQAQTINHQLKPAQRQELIAGYCGQRYNRRHKPGRALERAHYSFDIICDYGIFRDLQRHRMVDGLTWQDLSPDHGYDIPDLIKQVDFEYLVNDCFELSENLYRQLDRAGLRESCGQLVTLYGHKMRWKITYNARQAFHLHELRTTPQGHPNYRRLVNQMHNLIAGVHPDLAAAMIFVNQDEDPELTRLASEKYSASKQKRLLDELQALKNQS